MLEVGIGGLHDSTNVVPRPAVTGITPVGIDHVDVLGHTIKEIAEKKGGIYKVRDRNTSRWRIYTNAGRGSLFRKVSLRLP